MFENKFQNRKDVVKICCLNIKDTDKEKTKI